MATLYIVSTPIGNLADITYRAVEVLKGVDLVLAEDTRVTKRLLDHYGIDTPFKTYEENSHAKMAPRVVGWLSEGKDIALVSDAGTPGLSDPGARLVAYIRDELKVGELESSVAVIPVPGASALLAALSVSGLPGDKFTFLGFPPHKKGRETFFKKIVGYDVRPVVFYESKHRLAKALESLGGTEVIVASELTKLHEEFWHGRASDALTYFTGDNAKGEFVIIVP